jgi:hypothetical protein
MKPKIFTLIAICLPTIRLFSPEIVRNAVDKYV